MKRFSMFILLLSILQGVFSQVPGKFNYQAVVRDANGAVIAGETVMFRLSILQDNVEGQEIYTEEQSVTTDAHGVATLAIGDDGTPMGGLPPIHWEAGPHFLRVEVDRGGSGTKFEHIGTSQLISVPYALTSAALSSPTRKFTIQAEDGHAPDDALFEVVDAQGNVLFAVYPEGTRIYIDDSGAKGIKGGFAVGGYVQDKKGITREFLRVTPDSVRIYIDDPVNKGVKGGFAVGGYVQSKQGGINPHLFVSADSTDVYTADPLNGGFSVKLSEKQVKGGRDRLMNVKVDNSFVGFEAGYANEGGVRNAYLGYQAGYANKSGSDNVFLGPEAGFESQGSNNVYVGSGAGATNAAGSNNIFLGNLAGQIEDGSNRLYIESGGDNDFTNALIYGEFDNDRVRINSSLGVNTSPTNYTFEVDGDVAKSSPEDWNTISDYRVKRRIREISGACGTIMQLRPVTYSYKKSWLDEHSGLTDKTYYNFIAQEYGEVFPEAVTQVDKYIDGDEEALYEMNGQPAQVVAIKAIQELIEENQLQQEQIEMLQQENQQLKALEKRLSKLEKKVK